MRGHQWVNSCHEENARSNHCRCVNERADWRWAFHGIGQPDMERHLTRLSNRTAEDQKADPRRDSHSRGRSLSDQFGKAGSFEAASAVIVKKERARFGIKPDHPEKEREITNPSCNK